GSITRTCVAGAVPCRAQGCDEARDRCVPPCPDADGDGHADWRCGGTDCDDADPNRSPGLTEICDADGHDEDCDYSTVGARDADGDGHVDNRCCNGYGDQRHCGTDCDDQVFSVHPGVLVCDGPGVFFCAQNGHLYDERCPAGTACIAQPNGTGMCAVAPE